MDFWRLSNHIDLSGAGGLRASGRWHTRGARIVYLADHPSSCVLEMLVHTDRDLLPETYRLLRIAVPDQRLIETLDSSLLPIDWVTRPDVTRQIGDAWLSSSVTVLLSVPYAISPHARNYLFNPAHPMRVRSRSSKS